MSEETKRKPSKITLLKRETKKAKKEFDAITNQIESIKQGLDDLPDLEEQMIVAERAYEEAKDEWLLAENL